MRVAESLARIGRDRQELPTDYPDRQAPQQRRQQKAVRLNSGLLSKCIHQLIRRSGLNLDRENSLAPAEAEVAQRDHDQQNHLPQQRVEHGRRAGRIREVRQCQKEQREGGEDVHHFLAAGRVDFELAFDALQFPASCG